MFLHPLRAYFLKSFFWFVLVSSFAHSSFAYKKTDFVCPLKRPEFMPLMASEYPASLRKNGAKFKITWTKPLDRAVEEQARLQTVAKMYELAEEEIKNTSLVFKVPNEEIKNDSKLAGFFDEYVSGHSPKLNHKGNLKRNDAKACRKEAMEVLRADNLGMAEASAKEVVPAADPVTPTVEDPMAELTAAIEDTCFDGASFNECLKKVSMATLMCTSPETRTKLESDFDHSFETFKSIIQKQSQKLAAKASAEERSETKTLREAHYQIRLIMTLFPNIASRYIDQLDDSGAGLSQLRNYSEKIARGETLTEAEVATMHMAVNSVIQICRVDFLMDVREVFKDVITWSSAALTVASLAFGPIFGVTLLPAILNANTTVGFLVGINVLSHVVSVIDTILLTKDMRITFDQGKISKLLFRMIRYQKIVMDAMIHQIQNYHSVALEPELSEKDEKSAKKALIQGIKLSTEYQNVLKLYTSFKAANFNQAKQIINLVTFALSVPTAVTYDQALFNTVSSPGATGRDVLRAIRESKNPSAVFPALTNTRTALGISLTLTSIQYSLVGLNHAQLKFVKESIDSVFTFRP